MRVKRKLLIGASLGLPLIMFAAISGLALLLFFGGGEDELVREVGELVRGGGGGVGEREHVYFVYEKEGGEYLYYRRSESRLRSELERGDSPSPETVLSIYAPRSGDYYIEPGAIRGVRALATILSGEYRIIESPERHYDGFVVGAGDLVEESEYEESTEQIGVMKTTRTVTMSGGSEVEDLAIVWSPEPEPLAKENTVIKRVRQRQGAAGSSYPERVLADLDDVLDHYGGTFSLHYDDSTQVLYIR